MSEDRKQPSAAPTSASLVFYAYIRKAVDNL